MGFIWNIVLSFGNEELWEEGEDQPRDTCQPLERINQWIPHGRLVGLTQPTYVEDAGAGLDANLFGGGFKNFDIDRFIEIVRTERWKDRSTVQLWIRGAEEGMAEEPFTSVDLGASSKARPRRRSATARKVSSRAKAKGRRPR